MEIEQKSWSEAGWTTRSSPLKNIPQLVLVFGARALLTEQEHFASLKSFYPQSHIVLCSTAGEIFDTKVRDNTISVTAIHFESTRVAFATTTIARAEESKEKGLELAGMLAHEDLRHVMVFSEGLTINGTSLVAGLSEGLPKDVSVTGGLAGDGADFKATVVGIDQVPTRQTIVIIGFYGPNLKIGYGSLGGWDTFGPDRIITKSKANVLYELDDRPALELYKEYLGELASELPGSGLLFPIRLNMTNGGKKFEVVRTVLGVNEMDQSMTFAGDMPEGTTATLMRANFERLVDGATAAAKMSGEAKDPDLAILISCIGRKLVLKDRIEEETEAVRSVLGKNTAMAGFYSYGELCPVAPLEKQCHLHNQTMTITTFTEEK